MIWTIGKGVKVILDFSMDKPTVGMYN